MTANRLTAANANPDRPLPPKDDDERIRFWIAHGNMLLDKYKRHDLEWCHANGHYFITQREVPRRSMAA